MKTISKNTAMKLINQARGEFIGVTFNKLDGTARNMNFRLGVSKHLTGVGRTYNPAEYGLLSVWDTQAKDYRFVNTKTLSRLTTGRKTYKVA